MIDPHVVHGGASVWFCIAANELAFGFAAAAGSGFTSAGAGAITTFGAAGASAFSSATGSSRMFTPARNWASGDRNLLAIHRKM
jgi:hypothetical protein